MKKFLMAAVFAAVMGVAAGWAQDLDRPKDKFDDFAAKVEAAKVAQQGDPLAEWRANTEAKRLRMEAIEAGKPLPETSTSQADPFANMIVAKSEITAVTVYNNRAKVTRTAEVEVPAGAHTVAFQDLPAVMIADSLRAEGSARETVKFGAISHKMIMVSHLTSPRERELYEKVQSLQDQKEPFVSEKAALAAQETFLQNIGQQAALRNNENLAQIDLKPEQWTTAAQAIHNGMADVLKATAQQDQKLRDIDREIERTQRELSQISTGQQAIFTVLVPLEAEKATTLKIEVSYQVPNATWAPIYDARVSTDGKADMKLVQFGSVRQKTGEDWTGVALILSTAQPQRGTSLPDLQPMWINGYEQQTSGFFSKSAVGYGSDVRETVGAGVNDPQYIRKQQEANRRAAEAAMASGQSNIPVPIAPSENQTLSLPPPRAAEFTPAEINTGGFMSEYKITGPSNVPSDGTETKLLVGNFDVVSKLQVHVKPQISTEAYLVVHSKLKGDSPILPGQVSLFRDDAYVGQAFLPLLRPDEETDLYFGVDDQVAVKRKVLKDEQKQTGVVAKDTILERNYITELQNLHNVPIDIIVKETTPTPQNEKIKVDIDKDATTPGYVADADNIKGLLNWQFKMEPKEKKDLKLDWTVSWPSDFTVTGL